GTGHLYTEVQASIEIMCSDCHGTASKYPDLKTHGPSASPPGNDLSLLRSAVYPDLEWEVTLVKDTVTPGNPKYNPRAARAKLMSKGTSMRWGPGVPVSQLAHPSDEMACYTCHLSWTTSCA